MNNRIKDLRKKLGLTQEEFAASLKISRANLSNMEIGRINITDRNISDICREHDVNENWLRTGEGEMFSTYEDLVDELNAEVGLDEIDQLFFRAYVNVPKEIRVSAKPFLLAFAKEMLALNEKKEID